MHTPLFFTTVLYLHFEKEKSIQTVASKNPFPVLQWQTKLINIVFKGGIYLAPIVIFALPFVGNNLMDVTNAYLKLAITGLAALGIIYFFKPKQNVLLSLIAILLILRIGFNWFILPSREKIEWTTVCRESALRIGEQYKREDLFNFKGALGWNPATAYYLTKSRNQILTTGPEKLDTTVIYIVPKKENDWYIFTPLDTLQIQYHKEELQIGYLKRKYPNGRPKE